MSTAILQNLGNLLNSLGASSAFSAQSLRPADDLGLEVEGIGPVDLPVSTEQAEALCEVAEAARYGQGEKTLLDRRVRHTWEIPKDRVVIDEERWSQTLLPVLEELGTALGLATGRLRAELHSMLVYAPGHFFLPHQDSEKDDSMVGTLVVTLPSTFMGGALVVKHRDKSATFSGSRKKLSFAAFYADCEHEVRPVRKGYRLVLTYNLMLEDRKLDGRSPKTGPEARSVKALIELLSEHFENPLPPRYEWRKNNPPEDPPQRLVYLLDHQYTERGLDWNRLKGNDAPRGTALRAAGERYGCEQMLALAEIHESWHCLPPEPADGWGSRGYGRHRGWHRDEDDEWSEDDPPPADDPDAYELQDLIESEIELTHWVDPKGREVTRISTFLDPREVAASTPTAELPAHTSEYEGFMGNWGNTMDRWYRRAAIVLWPSQQAFAVRAEASPAWAIDTLMERLEKGELEEAREMASSLRPFWMRTVADEEREDFFHRVLGVATRLESKPLATSLLLPFGIMDLSLDEAPAFVALAERYGGEWTEALVEEWSAEERHGAPEDPHAWLAELPGLCHALIEIKSSTGSRCATLLVEDRWRWLSRELGRSLGHWRPSLQENARLELAGPLYSFLTSLEILDLEALRHEAASFLFAAERTQLLPALIGALRIAGEENPETPTTPSFEALRHHCIAQLERLLAQPIRAHDDWSIDLPDDCTCEDCQTLRNFLTSPTTKELPWPIAKDRRRHIHGILDSHELPVDHTTRRQGRPYTLVLTKRKALFEREAETRRGWEMDLEWLGGSRESNE